MTDRYDKSKAIVTAFFSRAVLSGWLTALFAIVSWTGALNRRTNSHPTKQTGAKNIDCFNEFNDHASGKHLDYVNVRGNGTSVSKLNDK
uniref:Conjugal transfer protein TraG n=1 Tax=Panagrellus redivivus TaxID=6233 RepID=A0A7E5A1V8_PANRE